MLRDTAAECVRQSRHSTSSRLRLQGYSPKCMLKQTIVCLDIPLFHLLIVDKNNQAWQQEKLLFCLAAAAIVVTPMAVQHNQTLFSGTRDADTTRPTVWNYQFRCLAVSAGYKIPHGGLFESVSAANYTAETLEWLGYAMAGWSLAPAAFAWATVANLAPRAASHHKWYKAKFGEKYPSCRKAYIPHIW